MNIFAFFENIPPVSDAVSIRSKYLINAFKGNVDINKITIMTTTSGPSPISGVDILTLGKKLSSKKDSFISRIVREVILGVLGFYSLLKYRNKVDVVYVSSPPFITSLFLVSCCKLFNLKYIYEIRDIYPEAYIYAGLLKSKIMISLFLWISKFIYTGAVVNVCATNGLENSISKKSSSISLITGLNGFPSELIEISNSEKYKKFTIVFHGILGQFQDVELICDIGRHLAGNEDIDMLVIGSGPKTNLIKEVFNQHENLKYVGNKSYEDTMDIVKRCHIGLSLRKNDPLSMSSFPVKSWEYFGLAVPSVTTPIGSEADIFLRSHKCGIPLISEKPTDIIDAILEVKSNNTLFNLLAHNARKNRANYTREYISLNLVRKVVSALK